MQTAKVLPFPGVAPEPAQEQPKGRVALTWELLSETAPPPRGAPHIHLFDLTQTGFGAYITKTNHRAYFIECPELQPDTGKWKRVRVTLRDVGKHDKPRDGKRDVEAARAEAILEMQKAARGEPISKAAKAAAAKIAAAAKPTGAKTFKAAYLRYIAEATGHTGKGLRPGTLKEYKRVFGYLADWHDLEMFTITRAMVSEMVTKLRKESQARLEKRKGSPKSKHTAASLAMKLLSAVWEFHAAEDEKFDKRCPVVVLEAQGKVVRLKRRERQLDETWVGDWWMKLMEMTTLTDHYGRPWWEIDWVVYFRAIYLIGGRMGEVRYAEWKHINFEEGTWFFPGEIAKPIGNYVGNKSDRDHVVYMGDYLTKMMREHWERSKGKGHRFVFTDAAGRALTVGANAVAQFRKVFPKFHRWGVHDARRTYLTLTDDEDLNVPLKIKKLLVNHEADSEVTLGYIKPKASKVRAWAEKVQIELLKRAGVVA